MNLRNFIKSKRHSVEAIENSRENGERVLAACVIMEHFDNPKNGLRGLSAKHGKSEILYAVPVELCRGNGWHVQGDGIRDKAGKGLLPFPAA